MRKRFPLIFSIIVLCCLCSSTRLTAQVRSDVYQDPRDQRKHATVETEVAEAQLRIRVSAIGQEVDALPGYRGRAGANMQTAYEMTQLLLSDRLYVVTRNAAGVSQGPWTVRPERWGPLPVRRISVNGVIDHRAWSEQSYWLSFSVIGSALSPGLYRTELWSRGELRLVIGCEVGPDGRGQVVRFEPVAHGTEYLKKAGTLFRYVAARADEDAPYVAPVKKGAWPKRDLEAKWVFFKQSHADGARLKDWVQFLQQQKDYAFLEMLALYEVDAFNLYGIGEILAAAKASNWLRMLDWLRGDEPPERGYGWTASDSVLLAKGRQDVVYSWIVKHQLEDQYPAILDELVASEAKVVDVSKYDPPFARNHFTRMLDVPEKLAVLPATAEQAEKDKAYVHQALRAIDAVVIASRIQDRRFAHKLDELRAHPHERVRQAVFLLYTHLPMEQVPLDLLGYVNNEEESPLVREAALLAHSYRNDPEIYADLLGIAVQPAHPAWKAAVSRLGELGGPFALQAVQPLKLADAKQREHAAASVEEIKERLARHAAGDHINSLLPLLLQRAAWMRYRKKEIHADYLVAVVALAKTKPEIIKTLLEKGYRDPVFVAQSPENDTKRVTASVNATLVLRELVAEVLDALE